MFLIVDILRCCFCLLQFDEAKFSLKDQEQVVREVIARNEEDTRRLQHTINKLKVRHMAATAHHQQTQGKTHDGYSTPSTNSR